MNIDGLGAHCARKDCQQLDFLPFTCKKCQGTFCMHHFKYVDHDCPGEEPVVKNTLPMCPICKKWVKLKLNQSPDDALDQHIENNCRGGFLTRTDSEQQRRDEYRFCAVKSCQNKQNLHTVTCNKCSRQHCLKHRLKEDHRCPVWLKQRRKGKQEKKARKAQADGTAEPQGALSKLWSRLRGNSGGKAKREAARNRARNQTRSQKQKTGGMMPEGRGQRVTSPRNAGSLSRTNSGTQKMPEREQKRAQESLIRVKSPVSLNAVKVKAVGDKGVNRSDRFYLQVDLPPINRLTDKPIPEKFVYVFFNRNATVAECLYELSRRVGLQGKVPLKLDVFSDSQGSSTPKRITLPNGVPLQLLHPALKSGDAAVLCYA